MPRGEREELRRFLHGDPISAVQALTETLEKKGFETKNDVKVKTNGNVRMDYMISQDKKFVAAQLFRFIPYTYEPASSVFYFTGDDASAFVHCLETSEF